MGIVIKKCTLLLPNCLCKKEGLKLRDSGKSNLSSEPNFLLIIMTALLD